MPKYTVEYRAPYDHIVEVGVVAESLDAALDEAMKAFEDGTIWDDSPEMPLLFDDLEQQSGNLEWEVTEVEAFPRRDESTVGPLWQDAMRRFLKMVAGLELSIKDITPEDAEHVLKDLIYKARELTHPAPQKESDDIGSDTSGANNGWTVNTQRR